MQSGGRRDSTPHGLAFLALLSFAAAFLAARTFATLNPKTVVVAVGIHFHHFWYGLAIVVIAGWLGIVHNRPEYRRFYAILFGLGCGLIGDEVGLLLTFGNYNSNLTFFFFVVAVTFGAMAILFISKRKELEYDVISLGSGERLIYLGVVVAGFSALTFAAGYTLFGLIIVAVGVAMAVVGFKLHRSRRGLTDPQQKSSSAAPPT